ncbi:MAG: carbonic anhydrase [bacterium]|nr:MAG: carbonic anhydrase [bacterium]
MTGKQSLERLLEGNRRFLAGQAENVGAPVDLGSMVASQSPIAAVLGCADSRVSPAHVFDVGPGEIFTVRVAGNIAGPSELGSLEYAVHHLKVPLLLVLGHEGCGAVKAALHGDADGAVGGLIREIAPAVRPILEQDEEVHDVMLEAVSANVWNTMGMLIERSPGIGEAVRSGALHLAGGIYSLSTGEVSILQEKG